MDFIVQNIIPYLILYKYITIFVIAFIAAFIVPIPSGNVLMISSGFASVGYLSIFWVIVISIIGNILGDNIGYWIARKYGKDVLSRVGFRRVLQSNNFKKIEDKFNKHPGFIIFLSRFEVISTLSVNLLSGISKTPYKKYFWYEFFGSISQVCIYSTIGYFFADSWDSMGTTIGKAMLISILVLILLAIYFSKKVVINKFK